MLLRELKNAQGTYVALLPISPTDVLLQSWAQENAIILNDNLHVTILYSRNEIPVLLSVNEHVGIPDRFEIFRDMLVLVLDAPSISARHEGFISAGGTHDYPRYNPHISLCKSAGIRLDELVLPNFSLIFGKEYMETLNNP